MMNDDLVKRLREDQPVTQDMVSTMQCDLQNECADRIEALEEENKRLREVLKGAGDVIESYHKSTGVDLGDASRMPFYADTMSKIDAALAQKGGE